MARSAGVYRLEHVPTGRFYVGSSVNLERRRRRWFDRLRELSALKDVGDWRGRRLPPFLLSTAAESRPEDWRFCVVEAFDGRPRIVMRRAEAVLVERGLREEPDCCMNGEWFLITGPRSGKLARRQKRPMG